ncbi:hypothetical protein [Massilia sp. LC238]|uniref:hypothetical protein n=1 Tax=Massilia sp. LC238 TaxID=1502852 RepID=UPI0004E31E77|nr:hypothetical protein [Massilia sp. LC238]KFC68268.1 hypothetical protein FG94_02746 [Massilia sp. LC238]
MSNQPQNDPSTTLGVGGTTSDQQGATPSHETQQETGGSGGDGLSRNQSGETTNAPSGAPATSGHVEAEGSAMTNIGRGPQDTRPNQASPTGLGLGTPETGGNQSEADLPPTR